MPKEGGTIPEAQTHREWGKVTARTIKKGAWLAIQDLGSYIECDAEAIIRATLVCYGRMALNKESHREDLEKVDALSSMLIPAKRSVNIHM
jgi:hypothetical protein